MNSQVEFAEPIRLVIELENTEANEALIQEIELLASSGDRYGNAGVWREDSETAICKSCHEAMPNFHAEDHDCLKEAN
jgi:hypothetical protein